MEKEKRERKNEKGKLSEPDKRNEKKKKIPQEK